MSHKRSESGTCASFVLLNRGESTVLSLKRSDQRLSEPKSTKSEVMHSLLRDYDLALPLTTREISFSTGEEFSYLPIKDMVKKAIEFRFA